jgi:hypothetical protein
MLFGSLSASEFVPLHQSSWAPVLSFKSGRFGVSIWGFAERLFCVKYKSSAVPVCRRPEGLGYHDEGRLRGYSSPPGTL